MRRRVQIERLSLRLKNLPSADGPRLATALGGALASVARDLGPSANLALRVDAARCSSSEQAAQAVAAAIVNTTREGR
jgi:hypothetical protein